MLLTRGTGDVGMKSRTTLTENKPLMWHGSVGEDLHHLEKDRAIHTDPEETRRRRTIKLLRDKNTWGFTLQTYGIKNKKTNELEVMTYVDYVELNGPAGLAGMRRGDVILSVNGETVEGLPHKLLVKKIQESKGSSLRLVVLFEDCCRKVELYERFIKLKQILKMKLEEYRYLEKKEHVILEGHGGFSRLSSVRSSLRSSSSSDWDRFSMVVSPAQMLHALPNRPGGAQHFLFPRPHYTSSQDDSSELSLNDVGLNDSFSDDSDAFLNSSASYSDINSLQALRKSKKDSASNKSTSSLITHSDVPRRDTGKSDSSDADSSQCEFLQAEGIVKGDTSRNLQNSESVKSESVVFTIENNDSSDNSTATTPEVTMEDEMVNKDKNSGIKTNKEDNSDNISVTLESSVNVKVKSELDSSQGGSGSDGSTKEDCNSKGENSATRSPPETVKRFVNGIRVNDFDQITKL